MIDSDSQDRVESLSLKAYERIKDDIISCELPPGFGFTETQLAARYRLGKAPIRWALASLAQEQLVVSNPRRGHMVTPVTLKTVHDLFNVRLLLEPAAAREAAGKIDEERLQKLDAVCAAGYTPGDRKSERRFLRANREFHTLMALATGNERLARILDHILQEMERLFHLGLALRNRTEEMAHEHKSLVEALAKGDSERAARLAVQQIEAARIMVLDALLSNPAIHNTSITVTTGNVRSRDTSELSKTRRASARKTSAHRVRRNQR